MVNNKYKKGDLILVNQPPTDHLERFFKRLGILYNKVYEIDMVYGDKENTIRIEVDKDLISMCKEYVRPATEIEKLLYGRN